VIIEFRWVVGQARTGRGIHGLPKVSRGPAKPDPYALCGRATPQTALCRAGRLWPSSSPLDTPSRTGLWLGGGWMGVLEDPRNAE
jgi:hypothetical protein